MKRYLLSKSDSDGFRFLDGVFLDLSFLNDFDFQFVFRKSGDFQIESTLESTDTAQRHLLPALGQAGSQIKRFETAGPDAENTFGNDAAV